MSFVWKRILLCLSVSVAYHVFLSFYVLKIVFLTVVFVTNNPSNIVQFIVITQFCGMIGNISGVIEGVRETK